MTLFSIMLGLSQVMPTCFSEVTFDEVQAVLLENNLLLKQGSVSNATLIDSPSPTKKETK